MEKYITAVDFGTVKTKIAVGEKRPDGVRVTAYAEAPSKGIHNGDILNIKAVKDLLRQLVAEVEEQMQDECDGFKVTTLHTGVAGTNLRCEKTTVSRIRSEADGTIERDFIDSMLEEARHAAVNEGEEILQVLPQSYSIDDIRGLTDIEGHQGREVTGFYISFIGRNESAEHTKSVIRKAGFEAGKLTLQPIASASAVLKDDEMELGAALVDIGGGTADLLIYKDNRIRYSSVIPFGGNAITQDIKQVCGVTEKHAEMMKRRHGSCLSSLGAENKFIGIADDKGNITRRISFRQLFETIEARTEEIIATVKNEIKSAGMEDKINKIVLTGGTANLNQISVLFRQLTGYAVRQALPEESRILTASCHEIFNYSSSALAGLILEGFKYAPDIDRQPDGHASASETGSGDTAPEKTPDTDTTPDRKASRGKGFFSIFKSSLEKDGGDNREDKPEDDKQPAPKTTTKKRGPKTGSKPSRGENWADDLFTDFFNQEDNLA